MFEQRSNQFGVHGSLHLLCFLNVIKSFYSILFYSKIAYGRMNSKESLRVENASERLNNHLQETRYC